MKGIRFLFIMYRFNPIIIVILLAIFTSYISAKTTFNGSVGQSSFIMLNLSTDKWKEDKLKFGIEGNVINRNIASTVQNVVDFKVYFGKKLMSDEDMSVDLRIGYGINLAYYPSNGTTDLGYAPVLGTNINYGKLNCKFMCSFYQNGIAIPYIVGFKTGRLLLGLQGIYGLNIGNNITTNLEIGLCLGIEL